MTDEPLRRPGSRNLAYFRIWSDERTPAQITKALGTKPTRTGRKGTLRYPKAEARFSQHMWILNSGLDEDVHIGEHFTALVTFALAKQDALTELAAEGTRLEIVCNFGDVSGQYPVSLHHRLLELLGELGVSLKLTWWMPESGVEPEDDEVAEEWLHLRRVPGSVFLEGLQAEFFERK